MSRGVTSLEPWLTMPEFAEHLKVSERWLERRIREGMPCALIGGRRKFRPSEVEPWLEKEGHITRSAA